MLTKSLPATSLFLAFVLGTHACFYPMPIQGIDLLMLVGICWLFPLYHFSFLKRLIIGLLFFSAGFYNGTTYQQFPQNHYSQYSIVKGENKLIVVLDEELKSNTKYNRFYGHVTRTNGVETRGKIMVYIEKDEERDPVVLGEAIEAKTQIENIQKRLNPVGFDYKAYLFSLDVHHQITLSSPRWKKTKGESNVWAKSRFYLQKKIEQSRVNKNTQQLLNTLLLGNRSQLDTETLDQYARAGVVHLFAISGLHIGLLLLFFRWGVSPLRKSKYGRFLVGFLPLLLLWCYAFMVGAKPSVIRAVTLFSTLQLAQATERKFPSYYLVLFSMVILLYIEPKFILRLGFQMSYLAVFGILFLHPIFALRFPYKPLQWLWNILSVSLAAQIAVTPLSIYHFHQFPGLFLLTNLVLLPCIGLFLFLGFLYLFFTLLLEIPQPVALIIDSLFEGMNRFVFWVGNQEQFVFQNLALQKNELFFCYISLIFFLLFWHQKKPFKIVLLFSCIALLFFFSPEKKENQFWITHAYGATLLVEKTGGSLHFYSDIKAVENHPVVREFTTAFSAKNTHFSPLKNAYCIGKTPLLVVDGNWVNKTHFSKGEIILLHKNPKINLERLLENATPRKVVIDGSNSPFYKNKWEQTLRACGVPFHDISKQGALVFTPEIEVQNAPNKSRCRLDP